MNFEIVNPGQVEIETELFTIVTCVDDEFESEAQFATESEMRKKLEASQVEVMSECDLYGTCDVCIDGTHVEADCVYHTVYVVER